MLKNINPLLGPELLSTLRAMGHGEDIAVVDRNYPTISAGALVIRLDGTDGPQVLDAILSVLPIDRGTEAVVRMEVRDRPAELTQVMQEFVGVVHRHQPGIIIGSMQPSEFRVRAGRAIAIVITGESRGYGNILVRKGALRA